MNGVITVPEINNINENWVEEETNRGGTWKYCELSGERLGVHIGPRLTLPYPQIVHLLFFST